ncbi:MAG: hypothetical protein SFX72_14340 [Isosphaeraceae bacterium]|nr:hypothetical protein [Isosphaeraceae bacterium]
MADHEVIRRIRLNSSHRPTGRTRHVVGGELAPTPAELRIARYEGDPGCCLLYCDETGAEITDTYHDSVAAAIDQAEWEFGTKAEEWETVES